MNVLIIEDETHTAKLLQQLIEKDPAFQVVHRLGTVAESVRYLAEFQHRLDVLFFDIELADGKSFEIFRHVDVHLPVIFCTAYEQYSLNAIKNNGFDYILKPFNEEEIRSALDRLKNLVAKWQTGSQQHVFKSPGESVAIQKVFLSYRGENAQLLKVEHIAAFCIEHEVVFAYTTDGKKCPLFKTMDYIESVSDPNQFYRINRQMLVNRESVKAFKPYFNRKVIVELSVRTEEQPIVSRLKVNPFIEWLTGVN